MILGMRVDAVSQDSTVDRIIDLARQRESSYVCVANVHMTMEAYDDVPFRHIVNEATIVTPDGMPLVWGLRALGLEGAVRVRGPDLVLAVAAQAAAEGQPIALYGGSPKASKGLEARLLELYPTLKIALTHSPPYRPLTAEEDAADIDRLNRSGARIVLVGLGCPKQERWMAAHTNALPCVLIGVGAAFDYHAGLVREAPRWLQEAGLEWLFRLLMEPRRLWRRYARHNPRFLAYFAGQLWREHRKASGDRTCPR